MTRFLSGLVGFCMIINQGYAAKAFSKALFSVDNTGINGYVKVTEGELFINLNLSQVDTSGILDTECTTNMGYHIHELYNFNTTTDRLGGTECGRGYTGNHWDPWAACGSATDNDYCISDTQSLLGTNGTCITGSSVLGDQGYDCSTTTFDSNPYACEVGDWSGKYGKLTPDENGIISYTFSSPYEVSAKDLIGLSVVFHCGDDNSRAFCSGFEYSDGEDDENRPAQSGDKTKKVLFDALSEDSKVLLGLDGEYTINIDPTSLTIPSDCGDLILRVYENWTFDGVSTTENCENYVGDFYDPTATCAYGSNNEFCYGELLCNDDSYEYFCNTSTFATGYDRFLCAPGDFGGKYGSLPNDDIGFQWGIDPIQIELSQLSGRSLVLQCQNTFEMLACGKFKEVAIDNDEPETTSDEIILNEMTTGLPTGDSDDDDSKAFLINLQFRTIMVIIATVGLMFL